MALVALGCALTLALFAGDALAGQAPVSLGAASSYAALAGSTVTSTGPTTLNGDLGVWPGTSLTGFPPGRVTGTVHAGDPFAMHAQGDLTAAYNDAALRQPPQALPADVGGRTLAPGVYKTGATPALGVTGTLTLDGQGDPGAVFVFQVGSALTTAVNSHVNLIGGAQSCNVFWQTGSSATLGTSSVFSGTILALSSIAMNDGVTLNGRALARNGAVTLINDTITAPHCAKTGPGTTGPGTTGGGTTGGGKPGGGTTGGGKPGGGKPGGGTTGGGTTGGGKPGGRKPGGRKPGGRKPGGRKPGGRKPGGRKPGGRKPGGRKPGRDSVRIYYADHRTARLLKTGRITAAQAPRAAAANGGFFHTCGISFRRRSSKDGQGGRIFDWGGRISCNQPVAMKFRTRLLGYKDAADVIGYGNTIAKVSKNEFSGNRNHSFGRVVVYLTGTIGFSGDPHNGVFGVTYDPLSVNRNTDKDSYCKRVRDTTTVKCHNIRSISFT